MVATTTLTLKIGLDTAPTDISNVLIGNGAAVTTGANTTILNGYTTYYTDNTSSHNANLGKVVIGLSPATIKLNSNQTVTSLTINTGDVYETQGWDISVLGAAGITISGTLNATNTTGTSPFANHGTTIYNAGTFLINASGVYTKGGGTYPSLLVMNSGGGSNLTSNNQDLGNLQISTTSTNVTLLDNLNVDNIVIDSSTTLNGSNKNILVGGNWSNSGTYIYGTSTVTLDSVSDSTITGTSIFYNLSSTTPGKKIIFEKNKTQTITNNLTLTGISGNRIKLESSEVGARFNLNPQGTRNVSFVSVKDSNNIAALAINPTNSFDGGNTINWWTSLFVITASGGGNGSISPSGSVNVLAGNNQAFNFTPNLGYHISDVLVDSISQGAITTYTFIDVQANRTISVVFSIETFTLTYTSGGNGSISGATPQTINYGSDGSTVTAMPSANYHFVKWSDNLMTASRTDLNITSNLSVVANFTINTFTLTYTSGGNGSISGTTPQTINYGSDGSTVTAMPSANYHFVKWSDNLMTASRTDLNITSNLSIVASFTIDTFTITPSSGANGSISPATTQVVDYGSGKTFNFTPNLGYHISDVLVDSISQGAITTYTFIDIQGNRTISVAFAIETFIISASAGAGGTINPSGVRTINYDSSQNYIISFNSGYKLNRVEVDGALVGNVLSYTFSNINNNHSILVTFVSDIPDIPTITSHTISATAVTQKPEGDNGGNGYISPSDPTTVENGQNQTFKIVAVNNTRVVDVIVDGISVGPVDSYTFTNVTTDHTIEAVFVRQFTIKMKSNSHGELSPDGTQTVDYNSRYSFTVTPDSDYRISDIFLNGETVINSICVIEDGQARCTIENIDKNITIVAQYQSTKGNNEKAGDDETLVQTVVNNVTKPLGAFVLIASNAVSGTEKVLSGISEGIIKVVEKTPPPVAYTFPYLLFILLALMVLIFIYQAKREADQAQKLVKLIELDKNIADQKESFLMLSAHYLRTPMTIIVSGTDLFMSLTKVPENVSKLLKEALNNLSAKVEEIFKQISENIFLKNINNTNVRGEKAKVFGSIYLWLPILFIAAVAAFANYLFVTVAGIEINFINYICEALVFVIIAQVLFIYFRKKQIEKTNRLNFAIILDKQIAVDNARNNFMRKIADDLKVELASLESIIENISDQKYLKEAKAGISGLKKLIAKFEFMALVEAGKTSVNTKNISLAHLAEDLVNKRKEQIEEKKLKIRIDGDDINLSTDKSKLAFILGNVLDNAIEYNKVGGSIKIDFNHDNNKSEIIISDTGLGISDKAQEALFKPFSRGTSTLRFDYQGMGTNLYIAKLVANYIGGDISIQSHQNQGTKVTVLLPIS